MRRRRTSSWRRRRRRAKWKFLSSWRRREWTLRAPAAGDRPAIASIRFNEGCLLNNPVDLVLLRAAMEVVSRWAKEAAGMTGAGWHVSKSSGGPLQIERFFLFSVSESMSEPANGIA